MTTLLHFLPCAIYPETIFCFFKKDPTVREHEYKEIRICTIFSSLFFLFLFIFFFFKERNVSHIGLVAHILKNTFPSVRQASRIQCGYYNEKEIARELAKFTFTDKIHRNYSPIQFHDFP